MSFRLRKFRTSFKIPLYFFRIMFMTTVWHQRERQFILNFTHFTLYWICRCANASIKVFHIDYFIKWKGNLLILLVKILVTPVPKNGCSMSHLFIYTYMIRSVLNPLFPLHRGRTKTDRKFPHNPKKPITNIATPSNQNLAFSLTCPYFSNDS